MYFAYKEVDRYLFKSYEGLNVGIDEGAKVGSKVGEGVGASASMVGPSVRVAEGFKVIFVAVGLPVGGADGYGLGTTLG